MNTAAWIALGTIVLLILLILFLVALYYDTVANRTETEDDDGDNMDGGA